ncbi:MAG: 4-(cytidine 5'-diphospho)-2-C-methyl-D-erythritol kinase [Propionibacteriaceae bacterium]|nr:4-(cytidine 5'-diphospho)-2-C-methyl-D-erythritol kinase [Propionibacteriaceae bacterium]
MSHTFATEDQVRVRVPAKINLALCVGAQRHDGYHELATLFQAVSLYDDITVRASEELVCEVRGEQAHHIGPGDENLAYRAARLLKNEYGVSEGIHLTIDKQIPVAGGMAGGSADAAGALLACSRFWDVDASLEDLMALGSRLGADVPFPLMGGCAVGLGRGETLTPALSRGTFHWVLALSSTQLSTPEVFQRFDELTGHHPPPTTPEIPRELMMALTTGETKRVGAQLINDLHEASCSLAPTLPTTIRAGVELGCHGAIISGSGPTVAFLVDSEQEAQHLGELLTSLEVAQRTYHAVGPVPGATVIDDHRPHGHLMDPVPA